jgi:sulfate/thiosulfate transport system ATP-binding protein
MNSLISKMEKVNIDKYREKANPLNSLESNAAISVKDISKSFGLQRTLTNINFNINEGEIFVVLGPSGSGKSTLLRIIAGLIEPDNGDIFLSGQLSTKLPPQKRNLGVVFQEHALFTRMTIEENISFGLRVSRGKTINIRQKVNEMLSLIRLEGHKGKYPSQLSGGQRQRVALARALAFNPSAVLFDEPFSALDAATRVAIRREVRELLGSMNIAAMFITHDQEEALELGDRIAVLNNGEIEQIGTPFEVYNHPVNEFVAGFLGVANVILGRWHNGYVSIGSIRIEAPTERLYLVNNQAIKVIFRPEDIAINFQAQLLGTPYYLGRGVVESISYVGPTERLVVRLSLTPAQTNSSLDPSEGLPITVTRTKWEATEMALSIGDPVVVGLKDYRILPHYPLTGDTGAKVVYSQ